MKIAIIGTGGVGGYFGGKLAKAGYDVTFLARGKHLEAIQQKGLSIESIQGNFNVNPVKATDSFQNGTVVKLAEKHGIDVQVNRFVYNCILPMELKARKSGLS